jgi:two-component system phosphate regulon response regulator PhoB
LSLSQTIFVLEDDADISRLVQYHLESAGFTVRPYLSIGSIVADAERQRPSLFYAGVCGRIRR